MRWLRDTDRLRWKLAIRLSFIKRWHIRPSLRLQSETEKDKTPAEYKTYYDAGYQTDVDHINITDSTIEFLVNGKPQKFTYKAAGYKILNYAKGNRGVRFLLKQTMPMLGGLNTSNLATTTSHQRKPLISTSSSAAIAKKVCSMKWTTGQRIIKRLKQTRNCPRNDCALSIQREEVGTEVFNSEK